MQGTADVHVGAEASRLAKRRRWRELTASMQADTLLRRLQRRDLLYSKRIHECVGIARRIEKKKSQAPELLSQRRTGRGVALIAIARGSVGRNSDGMLVVRVRCACDR